MICDLVCKYHHALAAGDLWNGAPVPEACIVVAFRPLKVVPGEGGAEVCMGAWLLFAGPLAAREARRFEVGSVYPLMVGEP